MIILTCRALGGFRHWRGQDSGGAVVDFYSGRAATRQRRKWRRGREQIPQMARERQAGRGMLECAGLAILPRRLFRTEVSLAAHHGSL